MKRLDLENEVRTIHDKKQAKVNITIPMSTEDKKEIDERRKEFSLNRAEYLRLAVIYSINSEDFRKELHKLLST